MGSEPPALTAASRAGDFFEQHIRPLLIAKCAECHGASKQESELRLDSREAILRGGMSGPAVVPGDVEQSLLVRAVRRSGDLDMPPDDALSPDEVASLEHWVQVGAPWPTDDVVPTDRRKDAKATHWAFQPIAQHTPPTVRDAAWCRTPIDAFVLAKLESHGLVSAPPTDRRTLIRRVTYDLTGLPPTPEEVQQFVGDTDPEAYARLVDRLLASPHYGEHWARHWLDVARYSDTKGYVYAREERFFVHAPTYRDWVVRALNDDVPYDRFLLLQLAADQVAPDDRSSLAALGFLTIGRRFLGVTHDIIDDQIDAVSRGVLGLTVACARCHDHKYDPIPTEDYYSLYGVFRNCTQRMVPIGEATATGDARAAFETELKKRQQTLDTALATARTDAACRVRERIIDYLHAQLELDKYPEENFNQILTPDDIIPASVRRWQGYLEAIADVDDPIFAPWHRFARLSEPGFSTQAVVVTQQIAAELHDVVNPLVLQAFREPPTSMRDVVQRYGELLHDTDVQWRELHERQKAEQLPDSAAEALRQVLYSAQSPCVVPDEEIVSIEMYFDTGTIENLWKLQGEVDRWIIQSPAAPAYACAIVDRAEIGPQRVFKRGNPAAKGQPVPRQWLEVLAGPDRQPFQHGSGRLELAQAIVSPDNPLTARVWVNRVWLHHFGHGLVQSPSDFGLRSQTPSHPELLDYLARELMAHGWSTKWLHRQIVLSATYQQQSAGPAGPAARQSGSEIDAENRLLWRMNDHRLTFEEWRDTLLAASGELDRRLGGRAEPLFTAQPENLRRTLYGLVDRQFLDSALRMFDFANPDLHIPQRSDTTVPQQALFAMNHPFVAGRARAVAARLDAAAPPPERIRQLYQIVYQRDPTEAQRQAALAYLALPSDSPPSVRPETLAWQYGYGQFVEEQRRVEFQALPYFTSSAWQGGPKLPDDSLGWVQLTAEGGHAGNDVAHAAVRRWTAPHSGAVRVHSSARHEVTAGDGVRCRLVSSRHGLLQAATIHNRQQTFDVERLEVEAGDTLDFVVDLHADLTSDQFVWQAEIQDIAAPASATASAAPGQVWNSSRDFAGKPPDYLDVWSRLAQVLLISNELKFVD